MEETIGWQYFVATGGLVLVKHSNATSQINSRGTANSACGYVCVA